MSDNVCYVALELYDLNAERKTGYYCLAPMKDKSAASVNQAILERFEQSPELPIRTVTLDNGTEFAEHGKLSEAWNAKVFFAHPYSSWEREVNANANGLLRQYFPKGMNLGNVTKERIAEVENLLNNRPRKRLAYRTPSKKWLDSSAARAAFALDLESASSKLHRIVHLSCALAIFNRLITG